MTEFVTGETLRAALRKVCAGDDLRCAVAYLGSEAKGLLGSLGARVICDATSGGTSPHALRALGAPTNERLRHRDFLHAKVYLSTAGLVVTSANASGRALGSDHSGPLLIEAGILCQVGDEAFEPAASWFEAVWSDSVSVDKTHIELAEARWVPSRTLTSDGSVLGAVLADPRAFDGVGFVIVDEPNSEADASRARKAAAKSNREVSNLIDWPTGDMFTGWSRKDVSRWPSSFIEFYRPAGRPLRIFGRSTVLKFGTSVFTRSVPINRVAPQANVSLPVARRLDANTVSALLERFGGSRVFFSSAELARALASIQNAD